MELRIQIIIGVAICIVMAVIVNMIRHKKLELKYALAWLLVGIGVFCLNCFPEIMVWLAKIMGIADPINMLFFIGFCFTLMLVFILTAVVSKMSVKLKVMAQELALLQESKQKDKTKEK